MGRDHAPKQSSKEKKAAAKKEATAGTGTKGKEAPETAFVKMVSHTNPKFAHNAIAANKDVTWTYECWSDAAPSKKFKFTIDMNLNKMKNKDENAQSKEMNDAAIAAVKKKFPKATVKLTSK